jgi:hypothetical protein
MIQSGEVEIDEMKISLFLWQLRCHGKSSRQEFVRLSGAKVAVLSSVLFELQILLFIVKYYLNLFDYI